ncbi:MAG: hypothetical protein ACOCU8_01040 [Patescibacteria group bacterium]
MRIDFKILVFVLLLIALLVVAYFLPSVNRNQREIYKNDIYNFSLSYKAGWDPEFHTDKGLTLFLNEKDLIEVEVKFLEEGQSVEDLLLDICRRINSNITHCWIDKEEAFITDHKSNGQRVYLGYNLDDHQTVDFFYGPIYYFDLPEVKQNPNLLLIKVPSTSTFDHLVSDEMEAIAESVYLQ